MTPIYIFDLDGTLVDSTEPILRSLNHALADEGLDPLAADDLRRFVGPPLAPALRSLLIERDEDPAPVDSLIDAYRLVYRHISLELAATYPGIVELLDELEGDHRLSVVTSKPRVFARPIVEALGLESRFEIVEGPGDTELEEKTVTLGRALARIAADARTHDVTMIGDRRHDIEAGQFHGTRTVGVTWGFGDSSELEDAGADVIVDQPAQLSGIG